jgi:hypothetical protein
MTQSTMSFLVPWNIHDRFVDIVRSDASPILDLIPSYDTLRFEYNEAESTVVLRMGEYGDSKILAHPNGSVSKRVIRGSKIRTVGTMMEVKRPMGAQCKAVTPFAWSETLQEGISTPMGARTHALVLMYMHIWALKTAKQGVDLPVPGYQSLYDVLILLRSALETEKMLPVGQRKIPAGVVTAYQPGAVDKYKAVEEGASERKKT